MHGQCDFCKQLTIDEERKFVLNKYYAKKGINLTVESDHNPLILTVNSAWDSKQKLNRREIFNLRNPEAQRNFFNFTNQSNVLTGSFHKRYIISGGKQWLKI